ncbi:hypothetical protein [Paenarthrobacter aurescens]|uniref:hypothetical protein n=1 Tax=Paenarthrobacter aurescens TaxID=43663 RepID=UPI0021C11EC3|nr:hypothetical protein [Paenarthrobacter aurescens]MCT9868045.1 hypothetical protein [Paenarthrobacter aurescens]
MTSLREALAAAPAERSTEGKVTAGVSVGDGADGAEQAVLEINTAITNIANAVVDTVLKVGSKELTPDTRNFIVPVPGGSHIETA